MGQIDGGAGSTTGGTAGAVEGAGVVEGVGAGIVEGVGAGDLGPPAQPALSQTSTYGLSSRHSNSFAFTKFCDWLFGQRLGQGGTVPNSDVTVRVVDCQAAASPIKSHTLDYSGEERNRR